MKKTKTQTQNQIEYLEVSKLVPYARNAKKHDRRANAIDWMDFGIKAVNFCRENKKIFYIKDDLAKALPEGFLRTEERNPDLLEI